MVSARFKDAKRLKWVMQAVQQELVTAEHILIARWSPAIPAVKGAEYGIDSNGTFAFKMNYQTLQP